MPRSRLAAFLLAMAALPALAISIAAGDGRWQAKVPPDARQRPNPMATEASAIAAGEKLFERNCASCHGKQAEGQLKHPDLHSGRVRNATPGELEWLLKNGSLKNGMPSWSRLPEPQRWQLVTFLKSLH
jgi:mono/diheme cytochrome c family protein